MEPGHQRIPFDDNRKPFLTALSYIDGHTAVPLYADPATGALLLEVIPSPVSLPTVPITGQKKVAVTGTAVQLTAAVLDNGIIITANPSNVANIILGDSSVTNTANGTGNGAVLAAGASLSIAIANVNDVYINGAANDWVSWIGS